MAACKNYHSIYMLIHESDHESIHALIPSPNFLYRQILFSTMRAENLSILCLYGD